MRELATDIERHLEGRPILARPDTWRYRAGKFVLRHRYGVGAAASVFLALVVGLLGTFAMYVEAETARRAGREREYMARIAAAAGSLDADDAVAARLHLEAAPPEHRGWEWRHLFARTDMSEVSLAGQVGVRSLAFSADGRLLACGDENGRVVVRDTESWEELVRWEDLGGRVLSIEFAPHGGRLVAAIARRKAVMLEVGERGPLWKREVSVFQATFAPDGSRVVVITDLRAELLRADSGSDEAVLELDPVPRALARIGFSPDGRWVVLQRVKSGIEAWDFATGERLVVVPPEEAHGPLAYLADGRISPEGWVTGDSDGTVSIRDVPSEKIRLEVRTSSGLGRIAASAYLSTIATVSGRAVYLWDALTGEPVRTLIGHVDKVLAVAFSPDGEFLASCSREEGVKIWRTGSQHEEFDADHGWHMGLALAPDGERAAVGAWDEWMGSRAGVAVHDLRNGANVWRSLHSIPKSRGSDGNAVTLD